MFNHEFWESKAREWRPRFWLWKPCLEQQATLISCSTCYLIQFWKGKGLPDIASKCFGNIAHFQAKVLLWDQSWSDEIHSGKLLWAARAPCRNISKVVLGSQWQKPSFVIVVTQLVAAQGSEVPFSRMAIWGSFSTAHLGIFHPSSAPWTLALELQSNSVSNLLAAWGGFVLRWLSMSAIQRIERDLIFLWRGEEQAAVQSGGAGEAGPAGRFLDGIYRHYT